MLVELYQQKHHPAIGACSISFKVTIRKEMFQDFSKGLQLSSPFEVFNPQVSASPTRFKHSEVQSMMTQQSSGLWRRHCPEDTELATCLGTRIRPTGHNSNNKLKSTIKTNKRMKITVQINKETNKQVPRLPIDFAFSEWVCGHGEGGNCGRRGCANKRGGMGKWGREGKGREAWRDVA